MTNEDRAEIVRMLADGFGVDDITVRLDVDAVDVRRMIGAMRISGKLTRIFRGKV